MSKLVAIEDNYPPKDDWLRVEWNLGKRCNYDCSYCGADIHDNTSPHMPEEVYNGAVNKLVEAANAQDKITRVSFTGGEPFVHPRFIDMLKYAKDSGINRISVTTNGSVGFKRYVDSLPYINYYIFSYHFEFAKHDKIMDTIVQLNDHVKEQHGHNQVHVHIMYLPGKLEECKELIKFFDEHDVQWVVRRIRPKIDPKTGSWAKPYVSGMTVHDGNCNDKYYSQEELEWLSTL